jgi:hypothetical protein
VPRHTTIRFAYVAAAVVALVLLIYAAACSPAGQGPGIRGEGEDEERPPIIVKNGSLIFESGDASSTDSDEKKGKPWKRTGNDWQPDHQKAKKSKWFAVSITGGSGTACPAFAMTQEVVIKYKETGGAESTFYLKAKDRGNGAKAPTIEGQNLAVQDNTSDNPKLVFGTAGGGAMSNVSFTAAAGGDANCTSPTSLKIWQF